MIMGLYSSGSYENERHEDSEPMEEPIPHCPICDSEGTRYIEDYDSGQTLEIPCSCGHGKKESSHSVLSSLFNSMNEAFSKGVITNGK